MVDIAHTFDFALRLNRLLRGTCLKSSAVEMQRWSKKKHRIKKKKENSPTDVLWAWRAEDVCVHCVCHGEVPIACVSGRDGLGAGGRGRGGGVADYDWLFFLLRRSSAVREVEQRLVFWERRCCACSPDEGSPCLCFVSIPCVCFGLITGYHRI